LIPNLTLLSYLPLPKYLPLIRIPRFGYLSFGGGIDFFIHTVFNYPTLGDAYKYAAYSALGKLNKARELTATT